MKMYYIEKEFKGFVCSLNIQKEDLTFKNLFNYFKDKDKLSLEIKFNPKK